jgi:hypothetical protein
MLAPVQWKQCQNRTLITQTFTSTSARMGHPILALVPLWGQCQYGVTRLLSSSSTGHPVPALGARNYNFWAQFQHWAPHVGTVPVWGHPCPSSSTGRNISPSSSTGPVPIWGLTYIFASPNMNLDESMYIDRANMNNVDDSIHIGIVCILVIIQMWLIYILACQFKKLLPLQAVL